jgi:hypothetical protein
MDNQSILLEPSGEDVSSNPPETRLNNESRVSEAPTAPFQNGGNTTLVFKGKIDTRETTSLTMGGFRLKFSSQDLVRGGREGFTHYPPTEGSIRSWDGVYARKTGESTCFDAVSCLGTEDSLTMFVVMSQGWETRQEATMAFHWCQADLLETGRRDKPALFHACEEFTYLRRITKIYSHLLLGAYLGHTRYSPVRVYQPAYQPRHNDRSHKQGWVRNIGQEGAQYFSVVPVDPSLSRPSPNVSVVGP